MTKLRNFGNKLIANRGFLMVCSVVFAFAIWLYITNVENKDIDVTIPNIPVNYLGEDALLSTKNYIVTGKESNTVAITFYGKWNVINRLKTADLSVNVDLSMINAKGTVPCATTVVFPSNVRSEDVIIAKKVPNNVVVTIDEIISREIPVRGNFDGNVADGFIAEKPIVTPAVLNVRGPSAQVNDIYYAQVTTVREDLSESFLAVVAPVLYDIDGTEVSAKDLSFDYDLINLEIPVSMIREIPLSVTPIPGGGANETNVTIEIVPDSIKVKGPASQLSGLNSISLKSIDLAKYIGKTDETFPIKLPDGLENMSEVTEASVTTTIIGLVTRTRTVSQFEIINADPAYDAAVTTASITVTVRGTAVELDNITDKDITITADVSDIAKTPGNHVLTPDDVTITIAGENSAGVLKTFRNITVNIESARER